MCREDVLYGSQHQEDNLDPARPCGQLQPGCCPSHTLRTDTSGMLLRLAVPGFLQSMTACANLWHEDYQPCYAVLRWLLRQAALHNPFIEQLPGMLKCSCKCACSGSFLEGAFVPQASSQLSVSSLQGFASTFWCALDYHFYLGLVPLTCLPSLLTSTWVSRAGKPHARQLRAGVSSRAEGRDQDADPGQQGLAWLCLVFRSQ